jgi:diaminohydroxyphosphoribosylaminopyrimidine deaminase/5-amino-6-(5-phosphoribosylamino)uracil reductase
VSASLSPTDRVLLERAIEIGRQGWGRVHPNPMVGCILEKDGQIIAEGWHEELGQAHAEVNALRIAGERARGSTAYVSLEPCNHFGRTPPCVSALLDAGVARVVFGAADPGSSSSGGGQTLQEAGVQVAGPFLDSVEARRENPAFFLNQEHGATYVALKLAQTLDGRIAEAPGKRTAITGPEARIETHRLRAGFDGVLVGSGTVETDDPLLTVREDVPMRAQPTRVVLDTDARLSPRAKLFQDVSSAPVVVFSGQDASGGAIKALEGAGATVHKVPRAGLGVSLEAVLERCWELEIRSLFCEGGGKVASQIMMRGLARRLYLFVAPFVLGEEGVPAFSEKGTKETWDPWRPAGDPRLFGRDSLLVFDRMD